MNQGSHGLGLNICHRISKNLNGNLSVFSEKGKGSSFTFEFEAELVQDDVRLKVIFILIFFVESTCQEIKRGSGDKPSA